MAFEIAHPQVRIANLSPARRLVAWLLGVAFLAGLAWSCATAYNAKPLDAPGERAADSLRR